MHRKEALKVLELGGGASEEEIKAAYRRLAKKYHPDLNRENKKYAEEAFKKIQQAYETLTKSSKQDDFKFSRHFQESVFEQFFQSFAGRAQQQPTKKPNPASVFQVAHNVNIGTRVVSFSDLFEKDSIKINAEYEVRCDCNLDESNFKECTHCHGYGFRNIIQRTPIGNLQTQQICGGCRGSGWIKIKKSCKNCSGAGVQKIIYPTKIKLKDNYVIGSKIRVKIQLPKKYKVNPFYFQVAFSIKRGDLKK